MIVIAVIGIPGCGKSKYCSQFIDYYTTSESNRYAGIIRHISYDDMYIDKSDWNDRTFQLVRKASLDRLENELKILSSIPTTNGYKEPILLVDDIFYLHSMRRQIYVKARNYHAKLLFIWIKTDLSIAIQRNSLRPEASYVEEEALINIYNKFEGIDNALVSERNCITISGNGDSECNTGIDRYTSVMDFVDSISYLTSTPSNSNDSSGSSSARNAAHQTDLAIRKLVSSLQQHLKDVTSTDRQMITTIINNAKMQTLQLLQCSYTSYEDDDSISRITSEYCQMFLVNLQDALTVDSNLSVESMCKVEEIANICCNNVHTVIL